MHFSNLTKIILLISTLCLVVGCGGGASGGTRNLPPVVTNTSPDTIDERTEATLSVTASDPDGSIREYRWLQTGGPRVSFTNGRDFITFEVPEVTQNLTLTFSIDVVDDFGAITSLDIGVNVRNINRAPQANDLQLTVTENSFVEFNLTGTDPDGDDLSFSITTQPTAGSLELLDETSQRYRYTPTPDSLMDDQISFSVSDAELSDAGTVSFDVVAAAKALKITGFSVTQGWGSERWVQLTNTGTIALNLSTYELRTQKLNATDFKPTDDYFVSFPNYSLPPKATVLINLTGGPVYSVTDFSDQIHLDIQHTDVTTRPYWDHHGFLEILSKTHATTSDFVYFGRSDSQAITNPEMMQYLAIVDDSISYLLYDMTSAYWLAKY